MNSAGEETHELLGGLCIFYVAEIMKIRGVENEKRIENKKIWKCYSLKKGKAAAGGPGADRSFCGAFRGPGGCAVGTNGGDRKG